MMKTMASVVLAVVVGMTAMAGVVRAGEDIPVKDLPEKVVKAIKDRFPGCELLKAEKEKDDGKLKYEVKVKHDGKKYEVEVSPEGKILEVEREDD